MYRHKASKAFLKAKRLAELTYRLVGQKSRVHVLGVDLRSLNSVLSVAALITLAG